VSDHETGVLESPAYPRLMRVLAAVFVMVLAGLGLWSIPALSAATWTTGGIALFALGALCIGWMGYWIVRGRTRLDGDELMQTWVWDKRVRASQVAQLKLVHWRALDRIVAPRLLVRQRNGAIAWFHSADARLLIEFSNRVAARQFRS
jgi:hypothetical protein